MREPIRLSVRRWRKKPLAGFPATVAVVRIEATGYQPRTVELYGDGAYRVVVTHDVEKPEQFKKLAELPMMAGFEPLNRLELPEQLNSNLDLRQAAARVHADMLLIYTFNTDFDDRDLAEALTLLTIGISPNKSLTVTSTASAVLIDTRNGYIYGACEATEKKTTLANCWGENAAAESLRDQVETAAFEKMVSDFQTIAWPNVVRQYATPAATRPGA
jgi:hypothetical protein